jgi:CRISPR-associated endonuclease/helicase Cas3
MCTSFKLKSHIFRSLKDDQLLVDHLLGVQKIAVETAKYNGINDEEIINVIKIVTLCHDFGKASSYFQDYLEDKYNGELKQHGEISAYFTYYMLPEEWKLIGFICVKRHHGNIDIDKIFFVPSDEENLVKISENIRTNKEELFNIYNRNIDDFFEKMKNGDLIKEVKSSYRKRNSLVKKKSITEQENEFIWLQYIWSLLLTGDKTQLIRGTTFENKNIFNEGLTRKYKDKVRNELIKKSPDIEKTYLFNVRDDIYNTVINSIDDLDLSTQRIFSINVPTGTGKTIAVYGAAFRLSEKIYKEMEIMPNIIYNIPFMSVIDQNYDVLEDIIKSNGLNKYNIPSDLILKHHSMSPIKYIDSEEKEYRNYDARFLMENWQSTIITTTFVQLFNTVFKSGLNGIMHRFHKLSGSIIILDEVQAVPPEYYPIIEDLFRILSDKFNCFIITVTATKPLFLEGRELVTNNKEIFDNMNRIIIENHTKEELRLDDFQSIVQDDIERNNDKSFLIIVNTVKSALKVYEYLKEAIVNNRKILYLSTEIIPTRRLEIIKEIKRGNEKYILVSTQLIEAGVDLDFDIVYRDLAPMDCINQSAGRANRNAINGKGIVKIYRIKNDNDKYFGSYVYSPALLDATLKILEDKTVIQEDELWDINNAYFKKLKQATNNKSLEKYNEYCEQIKALKLQEIRKFELIKENENKIDIIIRYNDEVDGCINIIENTNEYDEQEIINAWRELNKYRISINKNEVIGMYYEIKGSNFMNLNDYDKDKGVIRKNTHCI